MGTQQYSGNTGKRRRRQQMIMQRRLLLLAIVVLVILLVVIVLVEKGKKKPASEQTPPPSVSVEDNQTEKDENSEDEPQDEEDIAIVVIDAGHGGKDEGTSYENVKEKDIVLSMALLVQKELESRHIKVIMTRDDDTFLYLNRRVEAAEVNHADLYVSIHVDSYAKDSSVYGMTVHHQEGQGDSAIFAQAMQQVFKEADIERVRDIKASDLYVLANTTMPAVLIETGYITNAEDREKIQKESFQQDFAKTVADGVMKYIEENLSKN